MAAPQDPRAERLSANVTRGGERRVLQVGLLPDAVREKPNNRRGVRRNARWASLRSAPTYKKHADVAGECRSRGERRVCRSGWSRTRSGRSPTTVESWLLG